MSQADRYLATDYFGTRLIIFDNNMNTIEMRLILSSPWLTDLPVETCPLTWYKEMVSFSIHFIVEYNQAGSEIICRHIINERTRHDI